MAVTIEHGTSIEEAAAIAQELLPEYEFRADTPHMVEVRISPTLIVYFSDDLDTIRGDAEFLDKDGHIDFDDKEVWFDSGLPWDSGKVAIAHAIVVGVLTWAVKLEAGR